MKRSNGHSTPFTNGSAGLNGPWQDRALVDQCLAGDEQAWRQLYDHCQPGLLAATRAMLGRSADLELAEELAARVWLVLLMADQHRLRLFDPKRGCRLITYLATLARREVLRYRRSERRRKHHEGQLRLPRLWENGPAEQLTNLALHEFLATLTPRERQFCEAHLRNGQGTRTLSLLSASNRWQLSRRVRQKLRAFGGNQGGGILNQDGPRD